MMSLWQLKTSGGIDVESCKPDTILILFYALKFDSTKALGDDSGNASISEPDENDRHWFLHSHYSTGSIEKSMAYYFSMRPEWFDIVTDTAVSINIRFYILTMDIFGFDKYGVRSSI